MKNIAYRSAMDDRYWCSDLVGFNGEEENTIYDSKYGFLRRMEDGRWYSAILGGSFTQDDLDA